MSLDLTKLAGQIDPMINSLQNSREEQRDHLDCALKTIGRQDKDLEELRRKTRDSRTSWLVAIPCEELQTCRPSPPQPSDFTVLATDGSHIDVDRNYSVRCYLVNIGTVLLHYGSKPKAALASHPRLYSEESDLVLKPPDGKGPDQLIQGNLLGIRRDTEELRYLKDLLEEQTDDVPVLGLVDGSLIRWQLTDSDPEFVKEILLDKEYLAYMEALRQLAEQRQLALASYISYPGSTDVVNILKLMLCPYDNPDCDAMCALVSDKPCDKVSRVRDRDLFARLLKDGERSALFRSQSKILKRYGNHTVYFFYLRVGNEIARVELPEWVAIHEERVSLVQSLLTDQCRKGQGYPVALSEAHEQAVVTGADRDCFWNMVENSLEREKMQSPGSEKSRSKRTRWI